MKRSNQCISTRHHHETLQQPGSGRTVYGFWRRPKSPPLLHMKVMCVNWPAVGGRRTFLYGIISYLSLSRKVHTSVLAPLCELEVCLPTPQKKRKPISSISSVCWWQGRRVASFSRIQIGAQFIVASRLLLIRTIHCVKIMHFPASLPVANALWKAQQSLTPGGRAPHVVFQLR